MIPQAWYSQWILAAPVPVFLQILTGWVPGLSAIMIFAVIYGRTGVRELLGRFLIWRVRFHWYVIGIFLMLVLILGGIWLYVLRDSPMPLMPAAGASLGQIALAFLLSVLLGVLVNTEEIAWRGFALPRLQTRHSALITALLITIPEVLFHLPVFWDTVPLSD